MNHLATLIESFYYIQDILLTYAFFNFDLAYVQGMSDLLSPILYVMREEVEA